MKAERIKFGDDLPKENPWSEDRLGFAPCATAVATVILQMDAPNGYVIGVHGRWGTGKSTMLNFVLAHLKKYNQENIDDQLHIIKFSPWIISGHHDLIASFFKVLTEELHPKNPDNVSMGQKFVKGIQGKTDALVDAMSTMALTIDPSGGVGTKLLGRIAKKSLNDRISDFLKNPSLQVAYENLKSELAGSGRRFLVVIDDIDRLEVEEVKAIMRLVKSIGQLPNVIYLLSYDRRIISEALDGANYNDTPKYTEKIVQHEVDLPQPSRNALLGLLDEEIAFLTSDTPSSSRWYYIVRDGVQRWIKSPRDVVRLANAVKFGWPPISGEFDPQDLLAMEGLRLFDPIAFEWIRDNRDFLFSEGRFSYSDEKERETHVEYLRSLLEITSSSQVLSLLATLFPSQGKAFSGNEHFSSEAHADVRMRRGIGCDAGFDTYFSMQPSSDAIPNKIISDILSEENDAEFIERTLKTYFDKIDSRGRSMIGKLLDELQLRVGEGADLPQAQSLLIALFNIGEEIIGMDRDEGVFILSPRAQIGFLIRDILIALNAKNQADESILTIFEKCDSVAFLSDVFVARGAELGELEGETRTVPMITKDTFENIGRFLHAKILAGYEAGTLDAAPYYWNICRSWIYLGNLDDVKRWQTNGVENSAAFLVKVARGLVSYTIGSDPREYSYSRSSLPEYLDSDVVYQAIQKHINSATLSDDERALLRAVQTGLESYLRTEAEAAS